MVSPVLQYLGRQGDHAARAPAPRSLFPESKERLIPLIVAGPYAPPVHMAKLTETQEITLYPWGHPDEERGATSCGARLAESECEHPKAGNGDCEKETVVDVFITCPHDRTPLFDQRIRTFSDN